MWYCAPDPVSSISSRSDNGAGPSSEPLQRPAHSHSGPEDGVKPCNLLPYMPTDDREVLQQLQDIRLNGDVDDQSTSEWDLSQESSGMPREMPFDLLKEITDDFSNERKLGRGAYGIVYMGVPKCGPKIAVKMLHDMPGFDEEEFLNEFTNLARLDHPNIVRLLGYCYDIQKECHEFKGRVVVAEKIRRVLCLEYMQYGSLDKYLSDEGLGLKWKTCYMLIKGICKGLKYLHEESVFHLDLKPANILLDENMQPKIADFGLSKLFGEEKTWITKNCVGTHGYVPPEYIDINLISDKFDIFSLGVVIIKIMTGRKGYIRRPEMSPQEFVELALNNWRNKIPKSKYLFIPYSEQVKKCMEIALSCVDADRHKRPTIGDIVKQLKIEDFETIPKEVRRQGMSTTDVKRVRRQVMSTPKYEMYRLVGNYELGRTIGEGTFAKVRFARHLATAEAVAIKILDKEKVLKHKMVEQIKREISAMKLIKHPNVIRIYEVMGSKKKIYIVLEFATGGDLFDTIVDHGRMREDEARRYFQQLINAVDYCHSRGVYHRDLKPENLLLDSYGKLKVSGFGLSALAQQIKDDGLLHTICGTPNYVAPEVLEDEGYDGAMADLWSCGVILFFMLAGYLPFEDSNLMALYMKISNAEFTFPPWTSFPAKRLLTRILDPSPMKRITIGKILEDEWFKEGYKHREFDEKYQTSLDDVDALEEHDVTEKKEPVALNAFELISMSAGLNLESLFDSEQDFKGEARFISICQPKEIVRKIEEAAKPLGFDVQKENYKLRLKKVKAGRKGNLNVAIEIQQVAPSLLMVQIQKVIGDTLEFHQFCKDLAKTVEVVIWKFDDLQTQHASWQNLGEEE